MEHSDEFMERLSAHRFRTGRRDLAAALENLLGTEAPEPVDDAARATRLVAEFKASYEAAVPSEWALVTHEWRSEAVTELVETLHRIERNVGERRVWVLGLGPDAQAAASLSSVVLDNPLGFAGATDHHLALLDADVTAGVSLARHSHRWGTSVSFSWELEVWGEPWLSAATRALRGDG